MQVMEVMQVMQDLLVLQVIQVAHVKQVMKVIEDYQRSCKSYQEALDIIKAVQVFKSFGPSFLIKSRKMVLKFRYVK